MSCSKYRPLKDSIKKKFKTLKNFSRDAGVDYKLINKFFGSKMAKSKIDDFAKMLETLLVETPFSGNPQEITADDREYIRIKIVLSYHSYNEFVTDNPSFSKSFLSNVMSGKRKRKDERFVRLKNAVDSLSMEKMQLLKAS